MKEWSTTLCEGRHDRRGPYHYKRPRRTFKYCAGCRSDSERQVGPLLASSRDGAILLPLRWEEARCESASTSTSTSTRASEGLANPRILESRRMGRQKGRKDGSEEKRWGPRQRLYELSCASKRIALSLWGWWEQERLRTTVTTLHSRSRLL